MLRRPGRAAILGLAWLLAGAIGAAEAQPDPALVAEGARLFFTETFGGNGRTCATCHPAENSFTLDPAFIATRPAGDPLFVAEFNPALRDLEDPVLLRRFALIRENVDGFDRPPVLRSVPHTLALSTSVASPGGPRTGWSGDGSPGDGSLRSFATGAVIQHFPRTLARVPGVDFRLPTEAELDALEAFQLSLGRRADLALPLPLKGSTALLGQEIFLDPARGKCNICHVNAGANAGPGSGGTGNQNFDTGVSKLPHPAGVLPPDGGFGLSPEPDGEGFGNGTFNVPPLVEAAGTPSFFHHNAVATIEKAVEFYTGPEFAASPAAVGIGAIVLTAAETGAVAAFLRVLNALENIRRAIQDLGLLGTPQPVPSLVDPVRDIRTAVKVLSEVGLHPEAVALLEDACPSTDALARLTAARALLVEPGADGSTPGPVPCTGFVDVSPLHFAAAWIAALVRAGATAGCSTDPPLYCPDSPVTREQMAVLLLKARDGPDHTPPPCTTPPFADVPCGGPFAPWIQELVAQGITAGCGGGNYCPGSAVTREQVAVLLLRALGVTPAGCSTAPFADVPCSSRFSPWIQELVARGITAGCTPTTYCPTDPVTRAQMAVFLVKTFGLPL